MKDLMGLMKKAKEMQDKMQEMQDSLQQVQVEGSSGGGMVRTCFNGEGAMMSLFIDPSMVVAEESEILEDLIVAACADAKKKLDEKKSELMRDMTGGLDLPPGMNLPF